jgi:hypothetical protein
MTLSRSYQMSGKIEILLFDKIQDHIWCWRNIWKCLKFKFNNKLRNQMSIFKNGNTCTNRVEPVKTANNSHQLHELDILKLLRWKFTEEETKFMLVRPQALKIWAMRSQEIGEKRSYSNWNTRDEFLSNIIDLIKYYNFP